MGNLAVAEELGRDELEELYRLDASEPEPEDDEDYDDEDDEEGEGIEPHEIPQG